MSRIRSIAGVALAAALALPLSGGSSEAQVAGANNTVSALLALPWDVGTAATQGSAWATATVSRVTEVVIFNAGPAPAAGTRRRLHLVLISPDFEYDEFWCPVASFETTTLVFERETQAPYSPRIRYTCRDPFSFEQEPYTHSLQSDRGLLFVSHEIFVPGQDGAATQGGNIFFGDSTVIDLTNGTAYSFDAIHFRGEDPNGDRNYFFDGDEFAEFPATLATNFIAPTTTVETNNGTTTQLLLFTLDGRGGAPSPNAAVRATFFDDAGQQRGTGDIPLPQAIQAIDLAKVNSNLMSPPFTTGGSLILTPKKVPRIDSDHDTPPGGNENGFRITPVHGWLVQTTSAMSEVPGTGSAGSYSSWPTQGQVVTGNVAWSRALDTSSLALPHDGDSYNLQTPCVPSGVSGRPCL